MIIHTAYLSYYTLHATQLSVSHTIYHFSRLTIYTEKPKVRFFILDTQQQVNILRAYIRYTRFFKYES